MPLKMMAALTCKAWLTLLLPLVLVGCICGAWHRSGNNVWKNSRDNDIHSEMDDDKSITDHVRAKRSSQFSCTSQFDCIPTSLNSSEIPEDLISCVDSTGRCKCSECFWMYNDICQVKNCWSYDATSYCSDNRRSRLSAILLSAFLSSVGAANFYIGRNTFGGLQLGLTMLFLVMLCICICTPFCFCRIDEEDDFRFCFPCLCLTISDDGEGDYRFYCTAGIFITGFVIVCLLIISWWVIDLVIFIRNTRTDSMNCYLKMD